MTLFGWGKRKEEVKEIKEAVAGQPLPYPSTEYISMQKPQAMERFMAPMPPPSWTAPEQTTPPMPSTLPMKTAPLFVKVEKYKDILEIVAKLKGTLINIESVLKVRQSIDKLRDDADALIMRQLASCNESIAALDSAFARPPALEQMVIPQPEIIEGEMQQLSNRLEQLSEQLKQIG
ncbi:MAG: hypothetical protein QW751_03080 [Candidatus Aenigmatarchaeota archaeon]|nr:hypothetical protein [Candidatus Aenigmarchaeota archaeon]